MRTPSHGTFRLPLSPYLVGGFCGLARTHGRYSQGASTPDATTLVKSRTCWCKRKEGSFWALHHQPIPHQCGFISNFHHPDLPAIHFRKSLRHLSSATSRLNAIYFPHFPNPIPIETTRLAREAISYACDGLCTLLRLMEFVKMSTTHGTEELAHELGALTADLPDTDCTSYPAKWVCVYEREGWPSVCWFNPGETISPGVTWDSAEPRSVRRSLDRQC